MKKRVIKRSFSFSMRGEAQCFVVDGKTKEVIKEYPKQKNLILNRFMEGIAGANKRIANQFLIAVASDGVTPTADDSGVTTASQAGSTVTLSGGAFVFTNTGTDGGKVIKWDSGEESRILTITSPTVATVTPSQTVASDEFIVYRVTQTSMANNTVNHEERAGAGVAGTSYLTGTGNCGTTVNTSTGEVSLVRTYDFAVRANGDRGALGTPYSELGFSELTTLFGTNLNSRILLAVPVPVETGQQLRVKYTLIVTLSPTATEVIGASPITNWATASGRQQIQLPMISQVLTTGATAEYVPGQSCSPLDPSSLSNTLVILLPVAQSALPNAFGSNGPTRTYTPISSIQPVVSSYTAPDGPTYGSSNSANALFIDKIATFSPSLGNGTWKGIVYSAQSASGGLAGGDQAFVYIIDNAQVKDSLHSLQLNIRFTWSRVLS